MSNRFNWTRRALLSSAAAGGGIAFANAVIPRSTYAQLDPHRRPVPIDPIIMIDHTDVRALAMRALEVAKSAGATYADVRLTRIITQKFDGGSAWRESAFSGESEQLGVGVRALVNGNWGFAASPYWNADDVVQLAREAARQATANARATPGIVEWQPIPVASGHWTTPIKVDPLTLSVEERGDTMTSWSILARRYRIENFCTFLVSFIREERAVATTDGAYFTQTTYKTDGTFTFTRQTTHGEQIFGSAIANGLTQAAAGWELLTEANIPAQIPQLRDAADPNRQPLPVKPGDIGRYDVVFDAGTMASLVGATIGTATQLDRALGYEANASGTSYLGPDPLALLGTFQVASPLVTITGDRSMARGLATVKWDDEGVVPDDITLVKDGVLNDYQTTRAQAQWLAPWYQKRGMSVHSHGCAAAESALAVTMQHTPNLVLQPSLQDMAFEDLIADTKRGLAVMGGSVATDFQGRTGMIGGTIREIVNGRLGAVISNLGCSFNTTQLWKNIKTLGGTGSAVQVPATSNKGQPAQSARYSIRAVPAKVIDMDFIDPRRKA